MLEVCDEAGAGWRPAQGVAGDLAQGCVVEADKSAQVAEVPLGVPASDGSYRNIETAADRRGDLAYRYALLGDGVQPRSRRRGLEREAVDGSDVARVRGRPVDIAPPR